MEIRFVHYARKLLVCRNSIFQETIHLERTRYRVKTMGVNPCPLLLPFLRCLYSSFSFLIIGDPDRSILVVPGRPDNYKKKWRDIKFVRKNIQDMMFKLINSKHCTPILSCFMFSIVIVRFHFVNKLFWPRLTKT